jgi:hypothetical protein
MPINTLHALAHALRPFALALGATGEHAPAETIGLPNVSTARCPVRSPKNFVTHLRTNRERARQWIFLAGLGFRESPPHIFVGAE